MALLGPKSKKQAALLLLLLLLPLLSAGGQQVAAAAGRAHGGGPSLAPRGWQDIIKRICSCMNTCMGGCLGRGVARENCLGSCCHTCLVQHNKEGASFGYYYPDEDNEKVCRAHCHQARCC